VEAVLLGPACVRRPGPPVPPAAVDHDGPGGTCCQPTPPPLPQCLHWLVHLGGPHPGAPRPPPAPVHHRGPRRPARREDQRRPRAEPAHHAAGSRAPAGLGSEFIPHSPDSSGLADDRTSLLYLCRIGTLAFDKPGNVIRGPLLRRHRGCRHGGHSLPGVQSRGENWLRAYWRLKSQGWKHWARFLAVYASG
jgi:hypothetical protein